MTTAGDGSPERIQLSSPLSRVTSLVWVALAAPLVLLVVPALRRGDLPLQFGIPPLVVLALLGWDALRDRAVAIDGETLFVRGLLCERAVPLAEVRAVRRSTFTRGRIVVEFEPGSRGGRRICFRQRVSLDAVRTARGPQDVLREGVDRARARVGAAPL